MQLVSWLDYSVPPVKWKYFTDFFSHSWAVHVCYKMCALCLDLLITNRVWSAAEAFLHLELPYQHGYLLWTNTLMPCFLKIGQSFKNYLWGQTHAESDQTRLVLLEDWAKMTSQYATCSSFFLHGISCPTLWARTIHVVWTQPLGTQPRGGNILCNTMWDFPILFGLVAVCAIDPFYQFQLSVVKS